MIFKGTVLGLVLVAGANDGGPDPRLACFALLRNEAELADYAVTAWFRREVSQALAAGVKVKYRVVVRTPSGWVERFVGDGPRLSTALVWATAANKSRAAKYDIEVQIFEPSSTSENSYASSLFVSCTTKGAELVEVE